MKFSTKILGHPAHPMLIVFPLGLLSTSVIFDALHLATKNKDLAKVSFWTLAAGIVGGLAAAPVGALDWLGLPKNTRAKRIGLIHGVGNLGVTALFGVSWLLRKDKPEQPPAAALALSALGISAATATAWLGGELVYRMGVSIDEGAHLNSPSSLSNQPASAEQQPPAPKSQVKHDHHADRYIDLTLPAHDSSEVQ